MYKYSKDGISVLSVLDARRAKKSGLFPVKIQVIHNRRQKYYSTGQELSKEDWANLACNLQIFLCLFLEKLNMPQNTPVTKAS